MCCDAGVLPEEYVREAAALGDAIRSSFAAPVAALRGPVSAPCATFSAVLSLPHGARFDLGLSIVYKRGAGRGYIKK